MALNNCVGVRNMRAFVTFLVVSFAFGLTGAASSLCVLLIDRDYAQRSIEMVIGTSSGVAVAIITFLLTVKPHFNNCVRLVLLIGGIVLAIGLTVFFSQDAASIVAAPYFYVATGYCLVIKDMLSEYLDLVSRHLTVKEKAARLTA